MSLGLYVPPIRRLHDQRNLLMAERDMLLVERSSLSAERDALLTARASLEAERDQLAAEKNELSTIQLLRRFTPYRVPGVDKIRVGRNGDGGYVMLEDFANIAWVLSLGIGSDCSWDLDVASRGIDVHMYDHTVDAPPVAHPRFHFNKMMIDTATTETSVSLGTLVNTLVRPTEKAILKIDIEGAEWDIFDQCDEADLARFSQIVCEFHWFSKSTDPAWTDRALRCMRKLLSHFAVIHIHGNNYAPMATIAGMSFPEVIEVTFANREDYEIAASTETFPTPLDFPNCDEHPDLALGNLGSDDLLIWLENRLDRQE